MYVTVHTCLKIKPAANCNSIRPIGNSPLAKGQMPGKPHSLALSKQQVLEQGVNSNIRIVRIAPVCKRSLAIWLKITYNDLI
ncbi:hypothetical protein C823_004702 [Eubacterium plexicaudatum ASF492]|uniref:Uncharacterized protein n=1 Tax=Eubacterium plexicaudatum ASF492 TaxID=1235802 RepID=N2A2I0_9FIRM|nr:hypothetical protein C823_004702 [Eubacterium plexicaudatum ASF492]